MKTSGKIVMMAVLFAIVWLGYHGGFLDIGEIREEQTYTGSLTMNTMLSDYGDSTDIDVLYYPNVDTSVDRHYTPIVQGERMIDYLIIVAVGLGISVLVFYMLVKLNIIGFRKNEGMSNRG